MKTELYHYNHNHDPRNGQFTSGSGGTANRFGAYKYKRRINKAYDNLEIGRDLGRRAPYMTDQISSEKAVTWSTILTDHWQNEVDRLIKEASDAGYDVTHTVKRGKERVKVTIKKPLSEKIFEAIASNKSDEELKEIIKKENSNKPLDKTTINDIYSIDPHSSNEISRRLSDIGALKQSPKPKIPKTKQEFRKLEKAFEDDLTYDNDEFGVFLSDKFGYTPKQADQITKRFLGWG